MNINKPKAGRGGLRPGAGRKAIYNERMISVTVRLPSAYAEAIRKYGAGNLSAGIRRLWEKEEGRGKSTATASAATPSNPLTQLKAPGHPAGGERRMKR